MKGFDVSLFNRSERRILPITKTRKIKLEGEVNATAQVSFATTNLAQAVKGRKLLMVVVPANAHREIAERLASMLEDGQIIVLNPGRTAGALEFVNALKEKGVKKDVMVAEAQTFVFASCMSNPGVVRIFRMKNAVLVAALAASKNKDLEETLLKVMPEFGIAPNTIYTSFKNIGTVFHPATTILNVGWVETTFGKFEFYFEGISPSVAKVLETIDEERCAVARKFGIEFLNLAKLNGYETLYVGSAIGGEARGRDRKTPTRCGSDELQVGSGGTAESARNVGKFVKSTRPAG